MDHDCKAGYESACQVCTQLFLERRKHKWNRFLGTLTIIHKATVQKQAVRAISLKGKEQSHGAY